MSVFLGQETVKMSKKAYVAGVRNSRGVQTARPGHYVIKKVSSNTLFYPYGQRPKGWVLEIPQALDREDGLKKVR